MLIECFLCFFEFDIYKRQVLQVTTKTKITQLKTEICVILRLLIKVKIN